MPDYIIMSYIQHNYCKKVIRFVSFFICLLIGSVSSAQIFPGEPRQDVILIASTELVIYACAVNSTEAFESGVERVNVISPKEDREWLFDIVVPNTQDVLPVI